MDQLDRITLELLGTPSTSPLWPLSVLLSHEDILSSEMSCLRAEVQRATSLEPVTFVGPAHAGSL
jgi:hypothetical protein